MGITTPAFAAAKITCTTLTGTISGTITVSGCTGGHTGGSSMPLPAAALAVGGTIDWVMTPNSTTIGAPVLTPTSAKKCPGYVKKGLSNPTAEKFNAPVTADTGDGIAFGTSKDKATGAVCISSSGNITALKNLVTS
ncbi:MAG: hypothetical protein ACLQPH_11965 [Acidimicrobiales bacterium]